MFIFKALDYQEVKEYLNVSNIMYIRREYIFETLITLQDMFDECSCSNKRKKKENKNKMFMCFDVWLNHFNYYYYYYYYYYY